MILMMTMMTTKATTILTLTLINPASTIDFQTDGSSLVMMVMAVSKTTKMVMAVTCNQVTEQPRDLPQEGQLIGNTNDENLTQEEQSVGQDAALEDQGVYDSKDQGAEDQGVSEAEDQGVPDVEDDSSQNEDNNTVPERFQAAEAQGHNDAAMSQPSRPKRQTRSTCHDDYVYTSIAVLIDEIMDMHCLLTSQMSARAGLKQFGQKGATAILPMIPQASWWSKKWQ
jgi:hypothetical protein